MAQKICKVTVGNVTREYPSHTVLLEIAADFQKDYEEAIVLAVVDQKLTELNKKLKQDAVIQFKTLSDRPGNEAYRRSATFLLMVALHDVVGRDAEKIEIGFSVSKGYYFFCKDGFSLNEHQLNRVKDRMDELAAMDIPIEKRSYPIDEAIEICKEQGMKDKERLFRYRRSSRINLYSINGVQDYYYGYMLPSTGYIKYYELYLYENGFVLQMPERKSPKTVPVFDPQAKLFVTMQDTCRWGAMLGIDTVGALNDKICEGSVQDLILLQEGLQESRIGNIAQDIVNRGGKKFVMIAGPSSSGKTTFSHRLSVQLMARGMKPHPIAVDNYFVNRKDTPRDENGDYNFECLEAIDIELFNRDMSGLLNGETVEIPSFNFKTGVREYKGDYKKLGPEDILVIEGIHGLNDALSYALPKESKYKIYISALTTLNVDEHNRIATTDGRLIRRMVRDARTRGSSAQRTLSMWKSVRRGEEENIFPFQEQADAMFNSALIYELAVLKQFAEPLLFGISKEEPEYLEAKRLLKFLEYFLGISSESIPNNSIVREFIGGSCFHV